MSRFTNRMNAMLEQQTHRIASFKDDKTGLVVLAVIAGFTLL
ncbi:hypothetical protein SIN8267_02800 [Sinobacterium norvegicum]|uniref:Uncharacterized protein n=1 Tax=Sinobacterium norvegicum TaxID=1641715 RepID=A0ABN8EMQ3_9GAMM|nr:hypothetical protein [Sinobacterium norvegicum]CAH0992667.1 hypothetical protein SIN8267_02800 [Sinobacterium norvegicum]